MANEENLHISIGGMLGDDVSSVLCFTTFTNTTAKFDGVATRRQALLESSREDENVELEGKWKTENFHSVLL